MPEQILTCDGCGMKLGEKNLYSKNNEEGLYCLDCMMGHKTPVDFFTMEIKSQEDWGHIAAAVNQGIDSHLEAITERSVFDPKTGKCAIFPKEVGCLIRRLKDSIDVDAQQLGEDIELVHVGIAETE